VEWHRLHQLETQTLIQVKAQGISTAKIVCSELCPLPADQPQPDVQKTRSKPDVRESMRSCSTLLGPTAYRNLRLLYPSISLSLISIEGDGNCGFRAIAHRVYQNQDWRRVRAEMRVTLISHERLWREIFSLIENNEEDMTFEALVRSLSWDRGECLGDRSMWFNNSCMMVAADTYKRTIISLSDSACDCAVRYDPLLADAENDVCVIARVGAYQRGNRRFGGHHFIAVEGGREFLSLLHPLLSYARYRRMAAEYVADRV